MRMEGKEYLNRISRETAMQIAGRELPQVEKIHLWVFPAFSYEEGIPVYLLKAYADLTSYDIILDARNGAASASHARQKHPRAGIAGSIAPPIL